VRLLCEIVWFILPAGLANMAPVFAAKIAPRWSTPVDHGARLGGIRIFGDHKTIRGMTAGVIVGGLAFLAQTRLWDASAWIRSISIVDYGAIPWWFGPLMAFGALAGDLVKSFVKRRIHREPGQPWFPFDQIDWMAGALAATYPIARPGALFVLAALAAAIVLSVIVKFGGYLMHLDEKPI
jgi:CDP-2,3-bis-(O-geranylgeranyl)-sn-glycerol synthase